MFRCERLHMTLSTNACAKIWESAQRKRPEPWEPRHACRTCPAGAQHAGRPLPAPAAEQLRLICPRCRRLAARLINGRLCVSCMNRQYEALKGCNAKGGRPRLCDALHSEHIAIVTGDNVRVIRHDCVASATEALIVTAKSSKAPIAFGVRGIIVAPVQHQEAA